MLSYAGKHYSFISHLANALLLNHDPERCFVTAFTSYYDASGSEDGDDVLVVVGLTATEKKWRRFESRWVEVLKKFSVPYFHFREFNPHKGPYSTVDWNSDERRVLFLRALIRELKLGINKVFTYGVLLKDYREIDSIYKLTEGYGGPYALSAGTCVRDVNNWVEGKDKSAQAIHILEKGDCGQRELEKLCKREGIEPYLKLKIDPKTGEWFVPFQGCDLLAAFYRRGFVASAQGKAIQLNESCLKEAYKQIHRWLPSEGGGHDRKTLENMCEDNPDEFPRR